MTKSNLRLGTHQILPENQMIEVWYEGILIASVYGADGPGVRVITKFPLDIIRGGHGETLNVVEVRLEV